MTKDEHIAWLQDEVKRLREALLDVATWQPPKPDPTPKRIAQEAIEEHQIRAEEANAKVMA